MTYAFFPGCVSKGGCPELYQSVMQVYPPLGIDLEEMTTAACTGAGVLQEKDLRLGDLLNAHTLALAERQGLPIMTICSTCQGVMSQANHRLKTNPDYLAEINRALGEEGLTYHGTTTVKHFVWIPFRRRGGGNDSTIGQATSHRVARGPVLWMLLTATERGTWI